MFKTEVRYRVEYNKTTDTTVWKFLGTLKPYNFLVVVRSPGDDTSSWVSKMNDSRKRGTLSTSLLTSVIVIERT